MSNKKWYYELSNGNKNQTLYCVINLHIKPEKLHKIICLDGYTAKEISEDEYHNNCDETI